MHTNRPDAVSTPDSGSDPDPGATPGRDRGELEVAAGVGVVLLVGVIAVAAIVGGPAIAAVPSLPGGDGGGADRPASTATAEFDAAAGTTVTVTEVVDGDTMHVRLPDGTRDTIRLLGVDTPETGSGSVSPDEWESIPDDADGRAWLSGWADRASAYAEDRLDGEEVYIETDPNADARGSYGRLLVYVSQNDTTEVSFNRRLIDRGYARLYDTPFTERSAYRSAEAAARDDGLGVWGYEAGGGTTTTDDGIAVASVTADAPGNDHENRNGEFIVLENRGDEPVSLDGWTLADAAGNTHTVPEGVVLEPGDRVTVYSGAGTDSGTELYWDADSAVWNNDGDTVILRDQSGTVRIEYAY
ncbi:micrococcal nuclease [Halopenitus malekzadehii]|uniref:Micrococcal nuclease n=1 Tax=Halopenitus malekzadehii TaxID=1267564 RepID=A0A1H6JF29_9EURY|nr:lamin tail domain-containing protein [Halopenitus malekzadehii]SEH59315.1 micrococcal nuclease [Halopenitus malekzadehii]